MNFRPVIAITCGEPAGIGAEVSIQAAWQMCAMVDCVLIGDASFLAATSAAIDSVISLKIIKPEILSTRAVSPFSANHLVVIDCPLAATVVPGMLDPRNGKYVLQTLDLAIEGAQRKWFDAIVTAPLQKSTINDAGVPFTGHTEYLAQQTHTPHVVMMLAGGDGENYLRVALATTHLPLKDVPTASMA